jgi:hypothetical protein
MHKFFPLAARDVTKPSILPSPGFYTLYRNYNPEGWHSMNTWQHTKVDISQAVVMLFFCAFSQTLTNAAVAEESEPSQQNRSDSAVVEVNGAQSSTSPAPERSPAYREYGWVVRKGERKVLWMNDEPGTLISTAMLPPGVAPVRHPFLTAQSWDPFEESKLREILYGCDSFAVFVKALKSAGYTVVPGDATGR